MATTTTDSPRVALASRDVNKLVASSPGKRDSLTTNAEQFLPKGSTLLPSKMQGLARSPLGSKKRGAAVLDDGLQLTGRKRTAIEVPSLENMPEHVSEANLDEDRQSELEREALSSQSTPRRSVTPDTSFEDSQNTIITEPEEVAPLPTPILQSLDPTPARILSRQEARDNAETLSLRLKVAMYKVRTNQTDLPLSRLRIQRRTSPTNTRSQSPYRTSLPINRLGVQHLPQLRPSLDEDGDEEATDIPSSPPAKKELATPVLPRSRDGYLRPLGAESPEKGLTSSVVKGRAADGLLSLMGSGRA